MRPVELVYAEGQLAFATKSNRKSAAVVLLLDPNQITDNFALAKLGEALKHFTTQNQWPPTTGAE